MRKFDGKKLDYILVPVVIDEESGDPSDSAFDQKGIARRFGQAQQKKQDVINRVMAA